MKVLIIGNGMSMDVANTPRDLVREMLDLYETNRHEGYTRDTCFSQFIDFIRELSEGYKLNFATLQGRRNQIVGNIFSPGWVLGDIEFILTMIDLNLSTHEELGVRSQHLTSPINP